MADYDLFAQKLQEALTGIANGLRGTYVNYDQSEVRNITNLQNLEANFPRANLS
jgi:hypothetical protein